MGCRLIQKKYKVGHYYWSGKAGKYFKVFEALDDGDVKVIWQNGKYDFIYNKPDIWIDFEVKRFEWKRDDSPVGTGESLTYNEIKALSCSGVIKEDIRYWTKPKGHIYYKMNRNNCAGIIYLERDETKSPKRKNEKELG